MPGAIRSFTGHFAPHAALVLCVTVMLLLTPGLFLGGASQGVGVPRSWLDVLVPVAIALVVWGGHELLRRFHDQHQCHRCDRNGARMRYRTRPLGFVGRHFHWRRDLPGAWIYVVAWFAVTGFMFISSVGVIVLYAGMALALASTIVHQARQRACPAHEATIMYDPPSKWFGAARVLRELHYRARGCEELHLSCERYACEETMTVQSPEEAMIWVFAHSDAHMFRPGNSPMVILKVVLDPDLQRHPELVEA